MTRTLILVPIGAAPRPGDHEVAGGRPYSGTPRFFTRWRESDRRIARASLPRCGSGRSGWRCCLKITSQVRRRAVNRWAVTARR